MGWFDRLRGGGAGPPAPALWPRPVFVPGGGAVCFELFVLRPARLPRARVEDLRVEGHAAAALPAGLVPRSVSLDDPEARAQLDALWSRLSNPDDAWAAIFNAAEVMELLAVDLPDAPDLGHVQAAWAWARSWCRAGALAVVDNRPSAFRPAAEVLGAPADDPSMACFYRIWLDPAPPGAPAPAALLFTAGMGKFGRPELVCFVPAEARPIAEEVMHTVARGFIGGAVLVPGEAVALHGVGVRAEGYAAGFNAPEVDLVGEGQGLLLRLEALR